MVTIVFEFHCTTIDNEQDLASGHYDVGLSELGRQQAKQLGERYKDEVFDVIFCSDLKRSYDTAEIAFAERNFKIEKDPRLRECDLGDYTRTSHEKVKQLRLDCIDKPFPNGESYEQTTERMCSFLKDLLQNYNGKKVMIIGHLSTQYGLEHWINNVPLKEAVIAPWHYQWRQSWTYHLKQI